MTLHVISVCLLDFHELAIFMLSCVVVGFGWATHPTAGQQQMTPIQVVHAATRSNQYNLSQMTHDFTQQKLKQNDYPKTSRIYKIVILPIVSTGKIGQGWPGAQAKTC